MYQAIVFLPLLGAILAGVIALVGARKTPQQATVRMMADLARMAASFIHLITRKTHTSLPLPVRERPS
jgi:uncharacterized protein (DUF39 family)